MKFKLRINGKMLLYILGTTIVVYVSALSYIAFQLRSNSYKSAQQVLDAKITEISNDAEQKLNSYMESVSVLAQTFSNYNMFPEQNRRELFTKMLSDIINKNPDYLSNWTTWEPNSIDRYDEQHKDTFNTIGNFKCIYYRQGDSILQGNFIEMDSSEILMNEVYSPIKSSRTSIIIEPYYYSYTKNKNNRVLQTNMVMPIISNNKFLGVVGINASISYIQQKFSKLRILGNGKVYIITNSGNFLSHPDAAYIGKSFNYYAPYINKKYNIAQNVKDGQKIKFLATEPLSGENSFYSFKPIKIGNTETPWSFCISVPLDTIYKEANKNVRFALIIGIIGLIIITIVILGIALSISNPIIKTTHVLQDISQGNISNTKKLDFIFNDEINDMALAMNKLIERLNSAAKFAQQIGKGDLNADYKLLGKKDALGQSLIAMQKSLIVAKKSEDEKRVEDEKRNWVTHGLAKFGEVIRQHNDDMEKFTMNIAQNIVDYIGVSQVAIYINQQIEDEDTNNDIFELKAAIAYGKPIMMNKIFEKGQELLGRATDENKTIYIENIPEHYVIMSPGMHDDKRPNNLLIVPLHINKITYGVIELLSFDKIQSYQIDFIEKLCENIASIVSSVKTNIRTEKLLQQSQYQADELAQHEEEMRQNLEEMQATQEEANKRQNEQKSYIKSVKGSSMIAELDKEGRILDITPLLSTVYGGTTKNMKGKYYEAFVAQDSDSQQKFKNFWETLIKNGKSKRKQKVIYHNKDMWLLESYLVIEKEGFPLKIMVVAIDKTKEKELTDKYNAKLKADT